MKTLHMLQSLDVKVGELGVVVRRPKNWSDIRIDDMLELCACTREPETHKVVGHGKVEILEMHPFKDIPARLIEFEYSKKLRGYSTLLKAMREGYGGNFNESEQVLVMGYKRID